MTVYKCPVCGNKLEKKEHSYQCSLNHSYDISKKGYVNLILANQGQHFVEEGDKKEMVLARTRFLENGHYDILLNYLIEKINALSKDNIVTNFLDVGCGEGYYTTSIHQHLTKVKSFNTIGLDISKSAINKCCGRKNISKLNGIDFCIGNLDYLPFIDNSFDILLNCFGPINEKEFYRVLEKNGYYIRVLPGKYHLYELKAFLYKTPYLNEEKDENMEGLTLVSKEQINGEIELNNQEIQDLFTMTPYYYKTSLEAKERLKSLKYLKTKISFNIFIYQKKD